jgi:UDP-2-acetamido-3-amino-2,3-dideoxy-glucuronate N-acetyltransferase
MFSKGKSVVSAYGPIDPTAYIHPQAVVTDPKRIGARTRIYQHSTVIRGVELGDDCVVANNVTLDKSRFGARCKFRPGVDVGCGLWAGNDVFFGPLVSITNDSWPRTHQDGWSADAFDGKHWANIIEDGVSLCSHVVVLPGVRIGARSMIAAGVVVKKDVPPNMLVLPDDMRKITKERERQRFAKDFMVKAA